MDTRKKAARTNGKRHNPNYRQMTAYVRNTTHREIKKAAVDESREISDLIQELLEGYLDQRRTRIGSADAQRPADFLRKVMSTIEQALSVFAKGNPRLRLARLARLSTESTLRIATGIEGESAENELAGPNPEKPKDVGSPP